jgi:tRNA (cytidine/uridine-2'-O-)-methyltransferase
LALHVILYEPEIPPNTGNVIRLCANTGARLHLIHPVGIALDEARLRRAGLDYREFVRVEEHADLAACLELVRPRRVLALSTRGTYRVFDTRFAKGDALLFGPESRGLPETVLAMLPPEQILRLPMQPGNRSLNLSNAVAVSVYEAWRQLGFPGAA